MLVIDTDVTEKKAIDAQLIDDLGLDGLRSLTFYSGFDGLYERTDPLLLHQEIEGLLDQLFRLPGSEPGHTEDIFETLAYPETP